MRWKWYISKAYVLFLVVVFSFACSSDDNSVPPGFIIIFTDDQGYGDVGCCGIFRAG